MGVVELRRLYHVCKDAQIVVRILGTGWSFARFWCARRRFCIAGLFGEVLELLNINGLLQKTTPSKKIPNRFDRDSLGVCRLIRQDEELRQGETLGAAMKGPLVVSHTRGRNPLRLKTLLIPRPLLHTPLKQKKTISTRHSCKSTRLDETIKSLSM